MYKMLRTDVPRRLLKDQLEIVFLQLLKMNELETRLNLQNYSKYNEGQCNKNEDNKLFYCIENITTENFLLSSFTRKCIDELLELLEPVQIRNYGVECLRLLVVARASKVIVESETSQVGPQFRCVAPVELARRGEAKITITGKMQFSQQWAKAVEERRPIAKAGAIRCKSLQFWQESVATFCEISSRERCECAIL